MPAMGVVLAGHGVPPALLGVRRYAAYMAVCFSTVVGPKTDRRREQGGRPPWKEVCEALPHNCLFLWAKRALIERYQSTLTGMSIGIIVVLQTTTPAFAHTDMF